MRSKIYKNFVNPTTPQKQITQESLCLCVEEVAEGNYLTRWRRCITVTNPAWRAAPFEGTHQAGTQTHAVGWLQAAKWRTVSSSVVLLLGTRITRNFGQAQAAGVPLHPGDTSNVSCQLIQVAWGSLQPCCDCRMSLHVLESALHQLSACYVALDAAECGARALLAGRQALTR